MVHFTLMQVLTVVEVAEDYRHNIVYQDNLLNIIKLYRDITFPLSHSPSMYMYQILLANSHGYYKLQVEIGVAASQHFFINIVCKA